MMNGRGRVPNRNVLCTTSTYRVEKKDGAFWPRPRFTLSVDADYFLNRFLPNDLPPANRSKMW
jgi:hypothetical protein